MKLRTRLTLTFGGLAAAVVLVSGLSIRALSASERDFAAFVNGAAARAALADRLRQSVDARAIAARNLVLVATPADIEVEKALVSRAHERVGTELAALKKSVAEASDVDAATRALVERMAAIEQDYGRVALAIVDLALAGHRAEAVAKMNDECRPLLAALVKASDDYAAAAVVQGQALVRASEEGAAGQRRLQIAISLLALAAAVAAGLLVTRSIVRPIDRAVTLAEAVAAGDLSARIEAQGNDEVVRLLTVLGNMSAALQRIVGHVRGSADRIAAGSTQIAGGNADLSQRTEEQASALQQTAASMEQLNAAVRQNADHAQQANQLALGASDIARRGGDVVGEVVATMKTINDSSRRIADIIGVIDGIAFQTNILALNAAVEAARAGEQGRGFAVVAAEVRSLAGRSADAAREIKSLIAASVERVEQGSALADRAGATMDDVVASIRQVTEIVGEISAASSQQSTGVGQVGEAVSSMDQMTQQNAALVEQSAAAAEGLRLQAMELVDAVAVFKLAPGATAA